MWGVQEPALTKCTFTLTPINTPCAASYASDFLYVTSFDSQLSCEVDTVIYLNEADVRHW